MKAVLLYTILFVIPVCSIAQTLPYAALTTYSDEYTAGKMAARVLDGVGFRLYWATEGLREIDISYKPGANTRTSLQTMEHIYEMSFIIANAALKKVNQNGQDVKLPFADMRKKTLENIKTASDILAKSSDRDMKEYKVMFSDSGKTISYPFWNLVNGPIEDCLWHIGQIVSFRRASGNPFNEKVELFTGVLGK